MNSKNPKLRTGFTTGTCAQAAAKAAAIMLTRQKRVAAVEVATPLGRRISIGVIDQEIGKNFARCAVIKDSGDDPDVTNGAKICAEVRFFNGKGVKITGGRGVGRVTLPGLAIKVGEWAINPVPRRMILAEAAKFLPKEKKGLEIIISVPRGEELARQTFNPKLGIINGISIIGTTGIVEPKSLAAYQASLTLQLDVLKAQGYNRAVLVLGYVGEKFCREELKADGALIIKIGDHIGFMLKECAKKKIKEILLIGHIGKLIKLTNNQFNTHTDFGDNRVESIARYAKYCGADKNTLKKISAQKTAEAAAEVLKKQGLTRVFGRIANDVSKKCAELVNNEVKVNCFLLSLNGELLAKNE